MKRFRISQEAESRRKRNGLDEFPDEFGGGGIGGEGLQLGQEVPRVHQGLVLHQIQEPEQTQSATSAL